jgi:hypothetical protein
MADLIRTKDPAIASYDYNDIADGTGVVIHYLYDNKVGRETPFGEEIYAHWSGSSDEKNYSTGQFNAPRILEGTAILSFAHLGDDGTTSTIIKIFHKDGATEEETQIGSTWNDYVTQSQEYEIKNAKIILPRTKFKRGDELIIQLDSDCGGGEEHWVGVDPQGRAFTVGGHTVPAGFSIFVARLPFRIGT